MNALLSSVLMLFPLVAGCHVTVPVSMDTVLLAERDKGVLALPPGARVRPGDQVSVTLRVDRSAHVYVYQLDRARGLIPLYPDQEDERVVAGLPLRIPARGALRGNLDLLIFSATDPLPEAKRRRRAEKAAQQPKKRRPGGAGPPIVVRKPDSPPGSIGEVRDGEELRHLATLLGTAADTRASGDSALRLWLEPEEPDQGEIKTKGAQ